MIFLSIQMEDPHYVGILYLTYHKLTNNEYYYRWNRRSISSDFPVKYICISPAIVDGKTWVSSNLKLEVEYFLQTRHS